jgi:hypothetical protein
LHCIAISLTSSPDHVGKVDAPKFVTINVGGQNFTTSLTTLQRAEYFNSPLALDVDLANVVIDRDPRAFEYLLNCLRDERYITGEKLEEYKLEIDFYGLDCLRRRQQEQLPIITVPASASYDIEMWCGVPRVRLYLKDDDFVLMHKDQEVDTGITSSLPYTGYCQLEDTFLAYPSKRSDGKIMFTWRRDGFWPSDYIIGTLSFHRDVPKCQVVTV